MGFIKPNYVMSKIQSFTPLSQNEMKKIIGGSYPIGGDLTCTKSCYKWVGDTMTSSQCKAVTVTTGNASIEICECDFAGLSNQC